MNHPNNNIENQGKNVPKKHISIPIKWLELLDPNIEAGLWKDYSEGIGKILQSYFRIQMFKNTGNNTKKAKNLNEGVESKQRVKLVKPKDVMAKEKKSCFCTLQNIKLTKLSPAEKLSGYRLWEDRQKELKEIEKRLKNKMEDMNFSVGEDTWISPSVIIDNSAKITIGNNCSITHRTVIYTHKHPGFLKRIPDGDEIVLCPLVIEDDVAIFSDCIIMPSVECIHKSCVILTGSVLTKSTTGPYQIWGGNPAKLLKLKEEM